MFGDGSDFARPSYCFGYISCRRYQMRGRLVWACYQWCYILFYAVVRSRDISMLPLWRRHGEDEANLWLVLDANWPPPVGKRFPIREAVRTGPKQNSQPITTRLGCDVHTHEISSLMIYRYVRGTRFVFFFFFSLGKNLVLSCVSQKNFVLFRFFVSY